MKQFSFDDEQSALSRMSRTVATTNEAISKHLTLDDKESVLSGCVENCSKSLTSMAKLTTSFRKKSG